jgi:hypothetical protein
MKRVLAVLLLAGAILMAGDFSTLTGISDSGYAASSTHADALGLTNPDSILSGTNRGIQNLGASTLYADGGNNRIVTAPLNVPKVLMGNQATFGDGFYVAKAGVNALTNTDPSQWAFNSNQSTLKVITTGTVDIPVSFPSHVGTSGLDSKDVTVSLRSLNLTGVPAVLLYLYDGSSYRPIVDGSVDDITLLSGNIEIKKFTVLVGQTSMLLSYTRYYSLGAAVSDFAINMTYTVRYYILQETAN